MNDHKSKSEKKLPNQRKFILRVRPFIRGDVLISVLENDNEIAIFNAPPELWTNEQELEILLRYLINQRMI